MKWLSHCTFILLYIQVGPIIMWANYLLPGRPTLDRNLFYLLSDIEIIPADSRRLIKNLYYYNVD